MRKLILHTMLATGLLFAACDKQEEAAEEKAEAVEEAGEAKAEALEDKAEAVEEAAEEKADAIEDGEKIELTAEGGKLDPPVKPERLPAGAWYCDMGTVHWAATEKPEDGKCPLCGMALKQYQPGDAPAAIEPKADEHGHDHADGEADHDHAH